MAQIFNIVLHGVILAKAGFLEQIVVVLPLLAASMRSSIYSIVIIGCIQVTVIAVAGRVT